DGDDSRDHGQRRHLADAPARATDRPPRRDGKARARGTAYHVARCHQAARSGRFRAPRFAALRRHLRAGGGGRAPVERPVRAGGSGRQDVPLDHVTPYDRFAWTDTEVEYLLASGEHQRELIAYFGAREHAELARLAQKAASTPARADTRVLVVPGIMGSQLGMRRPAPFPNDVLWVDPIDIELGRLSSLRLPGSAPVISLGAVLYSYLRVKLHLRAAGLAVALYDYDWRLGIDELGRALADRVRADVAGSVMIVAHSMGGLVSRAALALPGMEKVKRVVLMGTPNFGSFAPVQALRGTYAVVRKIARLVRNSSAESMAAEVFTTFPSLYHMLPAVDRNGGPDLLQPG